MKLLALIPLVAAVLSGALPAHAQTATAAPTPSASAPTAPAVADKSIVELGRLVAFALPLDNVFKMQIDKDPAWPLQAKASRVSAEKLACARLRLSAAGFLDARVEEAREFAKRNPASVEGSIRVLSAGAADMANAYFVAGGVRSQTGKEIDDREIAARFTPAQMSAFVELQNSSEHSALRRMIGMPDTADDAVAEILGRPRGDLRATLSRIMLGSMTHCGISLADIR